MSEVIDNEYNIVFLESLKEYDFESFMIVYSFKKSVYDECLKDLREDFSFFLYVDLKNRINVSFKLDCIINFKEYGLDLMSGVYFFDESFLLDKKYCVKNFKEVLKDFVEKIKEFFNDLNVMNEVFNDLEIELECVIENLS